MTKNRVTVRWSKAETERFVALAEKHSADEVAEMMNRTVSSVRSKAHQMRFGFGKLLGGKTRWTEKEKNDLCWYCAKKYTATEISWLMGKKKKPVYDMIRNLGIDPAERATRSQEVAAGHFTGHQLQMVRSMMNDTGLSAAEAAVGLGLDAEKICRVFPE